MFTIGQFSKITNLSIKTLRFYHQKEILVPDKTNSDNNYRYYSKYQISKALLIKKLKKADFSLKTIKEIISNYDSDKDLKDLFTIKVAKIDDEISRLEKIKKDLNTLLKLINSPDQVFRSSEICEKEIDDALIISVKFIGKYTEVGKYIRKLYRKVRNISGPPFCLYHDDSYKPESASIEVCIPVKYENEETKLLSGGRFYSIIHKGAYEKLPNSYSLLFEYINSKRLKYKLPIREIYQKGPGLFFAGNSENYITEILLKALDPPVSG